MSVWGEVISSQSIVIGAAPLSVSIRRLQEELAGWLHFAWLPHRATRYKKLTVNYPDGSVSRSFLEREESRTESNGTSSSIQKRQLAASRPGSYSPQVLISVRVSVCFSFHCAHIQTQTSAFHEGLEPEWASEVSIMKATAWRGKTQS